MDRISAIRNVESALAAFEDGEISLETLEERVTGVLRTYATEFEDGTAYRARGDPQADGLVVVAPSPAAARDRIDELLDGEASFEVEAIE